MAQVPFAVKKQVLAETQRLAQRAKEFSGLTNAEIEARLVPFGVVSDKGGSHFSELLNGKASKAHSLVGFRQALEKADLLPASGTDFLFHWDRHLLDRGMVSATPSLDLSEFRRTLDKSRTQLRADWKEEDQKAAAIVKAKQQVESALVKLADAIDGSPEFFFDLLEAKPADVRPSDDDSDWSVIDSLHEEDEARWAERPSTADQLRALATAVSQMRFVARSGWNYSLEQSPGANPVQTRPKLKRTERGRGRMKKKNILDDQRVVKHDQK